MSRILGLCLIVILADSGGLIAQERESFTKGEILANAGFSFGYYRYGFSGDRNVVILPSTASFEWAFANAFSGGPYVGFASWNYPQYRLNFISAGIRISWHFAPLLKNWIPDLNTSRWDVYISGIAGYEIRDVAEYASFVNDSENKHKFIAGPNLGVKYLFNDKTGIFIEGGRGTFGFGSMGLAFRL